MVELSYPSALGLTLLVEVPVYAIALPRVTGISVRRAVGLGVLVNVVSHPLLWFVLFPGVAAATGSNLAALVVSESTVWVGEAAGLWLVVRRRFEALLLVSLVANGLSLALGVVLQA